MCCASRTISTNAFPLKPLHRVYLRAVWLAPPELDPAANGGVFVFGTYATGMAASAAMMSTPFGTPNPVQAFQPAPAS